MGAWESVIGEQPAGGFCDDGKKRTDPNRCPSIGTRSAAVVRKSDGRTRRECVRVEYLDHLHLGRHPPRLGRCKGVIAMWHLRNGSVIFGLGLTVAASASAQDIGGLIDSIGLINQAQPAIDALGAAGSRTVQNQFNAGGNNVGDVRIEASAEVGDVTNIAGIVEISSFTMRDSQAGDIDLQLESHVGDVTVIGGVFRASTVTVAESNLGNLTAELFTDAGDVTVIGGIVELSSLSITNTTAGDVEVHASTTVGDITTIGGITRICSFAF